MFNKEATDGLLDFSNPNKLEGKVSLLGRIDGASTYSSSSAVSVHIVKSPAPSPIVNPSPRSGSSLDDELMDEAIVGIGK